jgi:hypothetical protein
MATVEKRPVKFEGARRIKNARKVQGESRVDDKGNEGGQTLKGAERSAYMQATRQRKR